MPTLTNAYVKIGLALVWSVIVFLAGWRVEAWHTSEKEVAALTAQLKQQNDATKTMVDNQNKLVDHIDTLNSATSQDQVHTQALIQDQSHAISQVYKKLATLNVGVCTLNPNADGVLDSAYQAAFPAAPADPAKH
jgi:hypothetical protein